MAAEDSIARCLSASEPTGEVAGGSEELCGLATLSGLLGLLTGLR